MGTWDLDGKSVVGVSAMTDVTKSENLNISNSNRIRTESSGNLKSSGGYSVVGINVGSIENMRDSIRNYVKAIQIHLDGIDFTAGTNNAFRSYDGEVELAVQKYISNVKEYCKALTSDLLSFSDRLAAIAAVWRASTSVDGGLAGIITEDVASLAEGTTYEEKFNSTGWQ